MMQNFFQNELLGIILPLLFYSYILLISLLRGKLYISKFEGKYLFYPLCIFILVGGVYVCNISIFYDCQSLSYGSDSSYFESILLSIQKDGLVSTTFNNFLGENKFLAIYLNSIFYRCFDGQIVPALFVFLFNLIIHFLSVINLFFIYNKLLKNGKAINSNKIIFSVLISYNVIALLMIFSFLRGVYILFFITEIIYLIFYREKSHYKLLAVILVIGLFYLKGFYAFILSLFLIFNILMSKRVKDKLLQLSLFKLVVLGGVFLIVVFMALQEHLKIMLSKMLILVGNDYQNMMKYGSDVLKEEDFYSGDLSLRTLIQMFIRRGISGTIRFILTPVFSTYLVDFTFIKTVSSHYYFGIESKVLVLLHSLGKNFIIFPAFVSSLFTLKKRVRQEVSPNLIVMYLIVCLIFGTMLIYGVKFFGNRHFKIDYVFDMLMLLFAFSYPISKKAFVTGVFVMVTINILMVLKYTI
ncbi:hypothetical protein L3073_06820 [Ancylomarina sp. DW003]|nr:hypothetical protein [Ancylomarina sp. DW003]MDE5421915.1 hypothetical protein [Ancylomarina sp. DW003]